MFEAKDFMGKRIALLEAVVHQLLGLEILEAKEDPERFQKLQRLSNDWQFHGHVLKRDHAMEVLGGPFEITGDTATRQWVEMILRANFGLLEVFSDGPFNPDSRLPGNSEEGFARWLQMLESPFEVVRPTRGCEFYKDTVQMMGGLPILKVMASDAQGRQFMHLIVLFSGMTMQSLYLDGLPPEMDWDVPDAWRVETFSYLNNMSKLDFLKGLAEAIIKCRSEFFEGTPVLFVPEGDLNDIALAKQATEGMPIAVQAVALVEQPITEAANEETESSSNSES